MSQCPWTTLGLKPGASPDDVKLAYRKLALRLHPDVNKHTTTEEFQRISAAYAALQQRHRSAAHVDAWEAYTHAESMAPRFHRFKPGQITAAFCAVSLIGGCVLCATPLPGDGRSGEWYYERAPRRDG